MFRRFLFYFPLLIFAFLGVYFVVSTSYYVRYWVDDFCSFVFLRNNGFFGAQFSWWKSWTGRYSAVFFINLFELIGDWVVKFLPVLWLFILTLSINSIFFGNLIFSLIFILLVLVNAPNITQSFYWQTGSLNYLAPFVFLNFFLSLLFTRKSKKNTVIPFLLMFVAGGFSEAFALATLVFNFFLILAIYFCRPKDKNLSLKFAALGFLGVVVSLFFMSLSPGNEARSLTVTKPESIVFVIKSSLLATKWYLFRMMGIKTFVYSLLVIFCLAFFTMPRITLEFRRAIIFIFLILLNMVLVTMAVMFSGYYSMSIIPPERTLFIVFYFILLSFYFLSLCLLALLNFYFSNFSGRFSFLFLFLNTFVVFMLLNSVFVHWLSVKSEIKNYADNWDREIKNLPRIKNIRPVGGLDSFTDNRGWVSSCVAAYYGFEKLEIISE